MTDEAPEDAEAEISAIFARLQHEVREGSAAPRGGRVEPAGRVPLPSRAQAQGAWAVTADRPVERQADRRLTRHLSEPAKRVLRKLMRWYVEPLAAQQRSFNLAVLTLVDELAERFGADAERLEARVKELESRLDSTRPEPSE